MTSIPVADVHSVFGIQSVASVVHSMIGQHADAFDSEGIAAAVEGYREHLTVYLPAGYEVVGDNVLRDVNAAPLADMQEVRALMNEDIAAGNGFDVSKYAKSASAEADDEMSKHSPRCQRSGLWVLHMFEDDTPCDEVIDAADTQQADAASIARVTMDLAHRLTQRAQSEAERGSGPDYHTAQDTMNKAHQVFMAAATLFDVARCGPETAAATKDADNAKRIRNIYGEVGNSMYTLAQIRAEGSKP